MPDPATLAFQNDSPSSPALYAEALTPHDTNPLTRLPKAIHCNTAGAVKLRAVGSATDVTFQVAAGQVLAVRATHVRATGTTVTDLVVLA